MHLNVKFECTKMYTGNVINAKILKLYVLTYSRNKTNSKFIYLARVFRVE